MDWIPSLLDQIISSPMLRLHLGRSNFNVQMTKLTVLSDFSRCLWQCPYLQNLSKVMLNLIFVFGSWLKFRETNPCSFHRELCRSAIGRRKKQPQKTTTRKNAFINIFFSFFNFFFLSTISSTATESKMKGMFMFEVKRYKIWLAVSVIGETITWCPVKHQNREFGHTEFRAKGHTKHILPC